jgi:hypothetical protein
MAFGSEAAAAGAGGQLAEMRRLRVEPLARHREATPRTAGAPPEPEQVVEDSAGAVAEACS